MEIRYGGEIKDWRVWSDQDLENEETSVNVERAHAGSHIRYRAPHSPCWTRLSWSTPQEYCRPEQRRGLQSMQPISTSRARATT